MRVKNILSVVPVVAISGCALGDGFQLPGLRVDETGDASVHATRTNPRNDDPEGGTTSEEQTPTSTLPTHVVASEVGTPSEHTSPNDTKTTATIASDATNESSPHANTNNNNNTHVDDTVAPGTTSAPEGSSHPSTDTSADDGSEAATSHGQGTTTIAQTSTPTTGNTNDPTSSTSAADTDVEPKVDPSLDAGSTETVDETTQDNGTEPSPTSETNPSTTAPTGDSDPTSGSCETILYEGFENITLLGQADWVMQNNSSPLGTTDWLQGDFNIFPAQAGGANSAITSSYTNVDSVGTISNWLVTPEVPLRNGAIFAFWTRDFSNQFADRLQVRMSTSGDSSFVGSEALEVGDFTELLLDVNSTYALTSYPDTYTQYQVTITGLEAPTTGRLAFRYFVENGGPMGSRSDYIAIDSVVYPFCDVGGQPDETGGDSSDEDVSDTSTSNEADAGGTHTYELVVHEGDGQTGLVGYGLNVNPTVRVLDSLGSGVSGVEVTFATAEGGGSVAGDVQVSDVQGYAHPGKWTLGVVPGSNALHATIDGETESVTFNATGIESGFSIDLQYVTSISQEHEAVFEAAKQRWQELIIGDLPDVNQWLPANTCGSHPELSGTVDDLRILVSVGEIDGVHGVLGQAGPCVVRDASGGLPVAGANGLPLIGMMRFDQDDLDALALDGQLESVILHEMGHVLGINSMHWQANGYLQNPMPSSSSNDTHFTGSKALEAFTAIGGAGYLGGAPVPVENCAGIPGCGSGTYNSHWREFALDNELMTGFVSAPGVANPLSRVTVASLWDIGYVVNMDGADAYYNAFSNLLGLSVLPTRTRLEELPYDGPVYVVSDDGISTLDTVVP